jgi:hypothetical protein
MCLDDEAEPNESYSITFTDSSPKWKKVTEWNIRLVILSPNILGKKIKPIMVLLSKFITIPLKLNGCMIIARPLISS